MSKKLQKHMIAASSQYHLEKEYWVNKLSYAEPCEFPYDRVNKNIPEIALDYIEFDYPEQTSLKLDNISNASYKNMLYILLASVVVLQHKYTGKTDLITATPIYKQENDNESEFINTILPLRSSFDKNISFKELLINIKNTVSEAVKYQNYPIEVLANELSVSSDLYFQTVVMLENLQDMQYIQALNTNMVFVFNKTANNLKCKLYYNTLLYKENTVTQIAEHITNLLNTILSDIDMKICDINILTEKEQQRLLVELNDTKAEYPRDKTIHELFAAQVQKTPDKVAVVCEEKQLTYRELNERANQLAHLLREKGITRDSIVGLWTERSLEMIIGILGILKAGGAYLPIDTNYPQDRIEYILEDSGAKLLLTQSLLSKKAVFRQEIILLDDESLYEGAVENPEKINQPNDLAYIIYTSGSTGKPKGVMIEHHALINRINWMQKKYPISEQDVVLQKTAYTFDVSVWELLWWSQVGATLCLLAPGGEKDPRQIAQAIEKNRVTVMHFVPSMLNIFMDYLQINAVEGLSSIKQVFASGEALMPYQVEKFDTILSKRYGTALANLYGPTEAAIDVSYFDCIGKGQLERVPIGKPIDNISLYILDESKNVQPIGVSGELYIAGVGLARGYLNNTTLTADKFVDNPFEPGTKMYRTGDLARWLSDGNIEFLGRIDHQVKIRGYRIELGEIETQLLSYQGVKEAIVTAKEDNSGSKYLCAYLAGERDYTVGELRQHLAKELPDYMIPSYFVQLEKLPLTVNGKLDRKALPEPDGSMASGVTYEAPTNEIEEKLVAIWQEILKIDKIGIRDNFFELGGHSLKATSMVAKLQKELEVEILLKEIFQGPTIKEISDKIKEKEKAAYIKIEPVEEKEYYKASSAQKRLYTLQQFDLESTSYNMPMILKLKGELDKQKLENIFKQLIHRHEALRTSFEIRDEEIVQIVHPAVSFSITDYGYIEAGIQENIEDFVKAFDLSKAPLLRVGLMSYAKEKQARQAEHILMIDMHHIITDGVSMGILTKDFIELYEGEALPDLPIQYKDYSAWQNEMIETGKMQKQEDYWVERFSDELPILNMPTDYTRPVQQSLEGDSIDFELDKETTKRLNKLAKQTGTTMYMLLLSAYTILLSKYSSQEDIIIGSPIAGRTHGDLENIIGMFVNTLAMRNFPEHSKTFSAFLEEVKENTLTAYENQEYQFEELVEKVNVRRDFSRNPIFDVMFAMQNMNIESRSIEGLEISYYDAGNKISKFDMSLNAEETEDKIRLKLEYCTKLFEKETIERLAKHYINILKAVTENQEIRLGEIEYISLQEREQLLVELNDTKADYPRDKTIHELFAAQVQKTPDKVAVVCEEKQLTYRELNERANQLAHLLREKGITRDSIVGLWTERSLEMIIGILGILKAGGAYLPIDTNYPQDRIEYILEDSGAKLLLTQSLLSKKAVFRQEIILLDDESLYEGAVENPEKINQPNDLAYIIYTSGSTGKPKGVMIEHHALINRINWMQKKYPISEQDVVLQKTAYTFDVSVWELLWWSQVGAALCLLAPGGEKDPRQIAQAIEKNRVTVMHFVPSMLNIFMDYLQINAVEGLSSIKQVFASGEALMPYQVEKFDTILSKRYGTALANLYGPTEAAIDVSYFDCIGKGQLERVPIGKPIDNISLYILDEGKNVQPIGVSGELYIAGVGLARGYLNNTTLTAEKFVDNPFEAGTKMYRTGDLARWLSDGNIEFLGRIDHQVKIRGYRIELGEIETQLLSYQGVKEAIVTAKEDNSGSKYLCAYLAGERDYTVGELRQHLAKELPDYMIPSYFVQLEKLPLTVNGKLDRKALPEPDGSMASGVTYEAPTNAIEERLVTIWQEILKIDKIGIRDNFFDLGGHSLKATILVSRIHKELNVEIPLREVFSKPTIRDMAEFIREADGGIYTSIELVEKKEYYSVSAAQKRMYILNQLDSEGLTYNMPLPLLIEGKLDKRLFEAAFLKLIERHEALRTSFETVGGEPVQRIHEKVDLHIEYLEEEEEKAVKKLKEFIKPFDLSKAPLFRVVLIKTKEDKHILLYDMHHIISDGLTMSIIINEFAKIYKGIELPKLRVQYKDYSAWQEKLRENGVIEKQTEYWKEEFKNDIPVLNLPTDYARPSIQSFEGDNVSFEVEEEIKLKISQLTHDTRTTVYMVLFAAFNTLLMKYTGQEDIIVSSPIAGRGHADLENIVGMFVNNLAIRSQPSGDKTFKEYLYEVKEKTLKAYENQEVQFEGLVELLNIQRDVSRNPLFDVVFVLNNADNDYIDLEEIKIRTIDVNNKISKFDIMMSAFESEDKIYFNTEFCTKLFKKETIEAMCVRFKKLLDEVLKNPDKKMSEIDILTPEEKNRIIFKFNDTYVDYPKEKLIYQLFEEQVERTPDAIAVICGDKHLTYKHLNEKSNQLARLLISKGIKKDSIVGIMIEHSLEAVIGIMGVLKAGGAYLPIDPEYPEDRIRYMQEDSGAGILLTLSSLKREIDPRVDTICLDDEEIYIGEGINPELNNTPTDIAYVIYTSGSTGNPKGVLVSHLGLVNYICWADKVYINGEKLDFPLYSSLCFDLTVTSIFTPLISGNKVIVYGGGNKEFLIKRIIEEDKVGIVKLTPTHLHLIREFGIKASNIKKLIVGGEDLKVVTANEIYKLFNGNIEIFNEYGPTEATVGCMIYKYDHKKDLRISVPIGVPAQNVQIYLLDQHLKPVPVNVVGEIYISGNGVARGYMNRAELTEKSFLPNPFIPDKKMYKTGDNARMLPDGNIEYIGRKDYQAKINGFRIETGEIEAQILKLEAVSDVVVDIRENKKDHNMNEIIYCSKCGLPSNYPNTTYDKDMVCNMCRDYYEYKEKADLYFKTMIELEEMFETHKANNKADYDCMVLFSGGKDSSYVLYKLVDMGFRVLALTLDNGYISETALENIDNIIKELKIDNVIIRPENMKEIFCESLMAESNVCNGCFKTLLALSTKMAYEKGIRYVVTGLSRGQIYEMRLTSLFISKVFDPQEVDKAVLEARKVYHGMDDYISRLLDVELLKDETVFDVVEFIDFYRYSDAKKTEIFDFLKSRSSIWSRPSDTGFCSSNCRINDVGIYVHCKEQGYHNYALPTCWEVRTNHLTLEAGKEELSGDVNIEQVKTILNEIGYSESGIRNMDFSKYLAAYYVADKSLTASELRSHLRKELPDYMVPLYFVQMEKLPLTPNGKLDRKALPEPHGSVSSEAAYEAPTNEIEEILVKIWQEVLGVKQVGIKDNFFALGGDSIKVIQASTRLLKYGMAIEHKDIFKYQTISVLAPFVRKNHREVYQGIIEGEVILTPIQRWYFENYRTNNNHFNHTVMLFRRGGFNEAILHKVLEKLLEHHDALRMVFREVNGEVIQYNMGISENKIRVVEIAAGEDYIKQIQVEAEKTQQSIDLQNGPLFKAVLFKTSQGDHLQVVIHHLIVDGISWRILLEDLVSAYTQAEKNEEIELPDKTDAYKLWAEKIYEYAKSNKMLREKEYWKQIDAAPVKPLPKDYDYDNICHDEDESIEITFTKEETNSLLVSVNKAYNTEINDILLTALGMAISDWTNESSVAVWLEGHGREEIIKEVDIKRTVGWFTSIYPFVLDMSKKEALGYQIKTVKEGLRKIPEKGVGYGIIKYMTDKTVVGENVLRLTPQIIFNYLGQFDTDMYTDSFKQSEISPGTAIGKNNERLYAIDISGMIANGKLSMSFGYSRKEYKRATIQKISDNYKSCLQRIINLCTELKESEVTPSDLGSKTLSLEGLDKINALLKNKLK